MRVQQCCRQMVRVPYRGDGSCRGGRGYWGNEVAAVVADVVVLATFSDASKRGAGSKAMARTSSAGKTLGAKMTTRIMDTAGSVGMDGQAQKSSVFTF